MQSEMTLNTKMRGARDRRIWGCDPYSCCPHYSARQPYQVAGTTRLSTPGQRPTWAALDFIPMSVPFRVFHPENVRAARRRLDSKITSVSMVLVTAGRLEGDRGVLCRGQTWLASTTIDHHN